MKKIVSLCAVAAIAVLIACTDQPSTQILMQRFYDAWDEGRYVDAVITADEIIERDPNDDTAYFNRGSAKAMLGRYREAIIDFDRVIDMQPGYDPQNLVHPMLMAYVNRGKAKRDLGDIEDARRDWESALEIAVETEDAGWIGRIELLLNPASEPTPLPPP